MKQRMKFGLAHSKTIAMLVLAGAITLPLQGCNEDYVSPASTDSAVTPKIDDIDGLEREHAIIGGLLYDKWAEEVSTPTGKLAPPTTTNPMMNNTDAEMTGANSWRCARCHGWDYKGADGRYGFGSSKYTGFPGLMDASELPIQELVAFITNGKTYPANTFGTGYPPTSQTLHNFGLYMTEDEIQSLAYFVKHGTLDTNSYIGKFTKETFGDGTNGAALYASTGDCVTCHGADGTDIDFDSTSDVEYVGTIGVDNPWEMLHKIRFGQPGSLPAMPSAYDNGLSTDDAVDIMTHTQTLPES